MCVWLREVFRDDGQPGAVYGFLWMLAWCLDQTLVLLPAACYAALETYMSTCGQWVLTAKQVPRK